VRRWFAISGLCHAGLLLALVLFYRGGTSQPREPDAMFECQGLPDPHATEIAPEPQQPDDPSRELLPDAWSQDEPETVASADMDDIDAAMPEADRAPALDVPDPRQLCVRLERPLRIPGRDNSKTTRPSPLAVALPKSAPQRPAKMGATRAPTLHGQPSDIRYPRRARRRGLEGTTELKILVARDGRVDRIVIARSSGHAILDEAARAAVASWRFSPALRNGVPVAAWTHRTVCFRLTRS